MDPFIEMYVDTAEMWRFLFTWRVGKTAFVPSLNEDEGCAWCAWDMTKGKGNTYNEGQDTSKQINARPPPFFCCVMCVCIC